MENKDILVFAKSNPPGDNGGFWGKNVEKKIENLTCRGDVGKKTKKLKILHAVVSIDHFQKLPFFTNI